MALATIRLVWPGASFGPPLAVELLVAGTMAIAASVVMIGGGIDLSAGAVMAFAGSVAATALHAGLPWWLALVGGLAGGAVFGLANGWLVAVVGCPPAMATLGSFAAANAVALRGAAGGPAPFGHPLALLAAVAAGMAWAMSMTVWGRHVVAAGGNAVAAQTQGVRVARVRFATYVVSALLTSVAGMALLDTANAGAPGIGDTLRAVAAAVIGGASLSGGEGGIGGALVGAALLVAIRHVLLLAGWDTDLLGVVVGICLVLAAARLRRRGW